MSPTIGSTSLTPLSSAGLWLAVTITPIHCPLSFLERRPARRPTAKTTVLRRSLFTCGGAGQPFAELNARGRGESQRRCSRFHAKLWEVKSARFSIKERRT